MRLDKFIFHDKASLVLRAMLNEPKKEWVVRDFVQNFDLSLGLSSKVLSELRQKGFIEGVNRGREAGSILRDPMDIIQQWTQFYGYERNQIQMLYTPDNNILKKIKAFFVRGGKKIPYALTLHSGANFMTHYVRDPNIYIYLNPDHFKGTALKLRQSLNLKELKEGGNVFLMKPYYKKSVFVGQQKIKGYPVVSNLQLYLDLFHFVPRGQEQAEMLLKVLKQGGKSLA